MTLRSQEAVEAKKKRKKNSGKTGFPGSGSSAHAVAIGAERAICSQNFRPLAATEAEIFAFVTIIKYRILCNSLLRRAHSMFSLKALQIYNRHQAGTLREGEQIQNINSTTQKDTVIVKLYRFYVILYAVATLFWLLYASLLLTLDTLIPQSPQSSRRSHTELLYLMCCNHVSLL